VSQLQRYQACLVFTWFFIGGIGHFVSPQFFEKIVPPWVPDAYLAVLVSGFFELLGALGLLLKRTRRAAAIGLFLLTVAVTPANIYMLQHANEFSTVPFWLLVARLPLQVFLLWCIASLIRPKVFGDRPKY
jgi:uncharacterized membrane protein